MALCHSRIKIQSYPGIISEARIALLRWPWCKKPIQERAIHYWFPDFFQYFKITPEPPIRESCSTSHSSKRFPRSKVVWYTTVKWWCPKATKWPPSLAFAGAANSTCTSRSCTSRKKPLKPQPSTDVSPLQKKGCGAKLVLPTSWLPVCWMMKKQRRIAAWGLDDTTQEGEEACCDKENVEASWPLWVLQHLLRPCQLCCSSLSLCGRVHRLWKWPGRVQAALTKMGWACECHLPLHDCTNCVPVCASIVGIKCKYLFVNNVFSYQVCACDCWLNKLNVQRMKSSSFWVVWACCSSKNREVSQGTSVRDFCISTSKYFAFF